MSKMEDEMTAFQIDERDNVATALKVLEPGTVRLWRQPGKKLSVREEIPAGHKVALTDIAAGENIVKYGVVDRSCNERYPSGDVGSSACHVQHL